MGDRNISCRKEKNQIGLSLVDKSFEGFMIGMVGNHLLVKMKWSNHVHKDSNALASRLAVSYFQTKHNGEPDLYENEPSP